MRRKALADLLRRYGRIFQHAWHHRRETDTPDLHRHEAQFLPAALALHDAPVHPAPRIVLWLIMVFALIACLWAVFGRIDIVATAAGKIIPNDRTKVIQPMETAVVKAIHVRDGQAVTPGQVLIELDATVAVADSERLRRESLTARLEAQRAQALLDALARGAPPTLKPPAGVGADRLLAEQSQATGQYQEYRACQLQLQAEIARCRAELQAALEQVAKLEQTAPIARQRAQDYQKLVKENFISQQGYLEREQVRIEQEQDLATSRSRVAEIRAALLEAQQQQATLAAETRRQLLDQHNLAEQKAASLEQELIKAEQRGRLMRLTAPVPHCAAVGCGHDRRRGHAGPALDGDRAEGERTRSRSPAAQQGHRLRESGADCRNQGGDLSLYQVRHVARHGHAGVLRRHPGRETGTDLCHARQARPQCDPRGKSERAPDAGHGGHGGGQDGHAARDRIFPEPFDAVRKRKPARAMSALTSAPALPPYTA